MATERQIKAARTPLLSRADPLQGPLFKCIRMRNIIRRSPGLQRDESLRNGHFSRNGPGVESFENRCVGLYCSIRCADFSLFNRVFPTFDEPTPDLSARLRYLGMANPQPDAHSTDCQRIFHFARLPP